MNIFTQYDTVITNIAKEKINTDCYVYYRVPTEYEKLLQIRVNFMQKYLLQKCGILGKLKRRPHSNSNRHTWMEVYLAIPRDFEKNLTQAVETAQLWDLIEGERHIEHFWNVRSCV